MTSLSSEDRFVYIRSTFFVRIKCLLIQSKCMHFKILLYWGVGSAPPQTPPHHFSKLNLISKKLISNFTMQISAYLEGAKISTEVKERPLKNIGTHCH